MSTSSTYTTIWEFKIQVCLAFSLKYMLHYKLSGPLHFVKNWEGDSTTEWVKHLNWPKF